MGMAASQARYLALTARKTNTEYEGQQINQARTALANQSANLFNRLLDLEVPVAPKTTDYTELQYSYTDGTNESVIESWHQLSTADPNYNYIVNHYYYADVFTGAQKLLSDPQVTLKQDLDEFNWNNNQPMPSIEYSTDKKGNIVVSIAGQAPFIYNPISSIAMSKDLENSIEDLVQSEKFSTAYGKIDYDDVCAYYDKNENKWHFMSKNQVQDGQPIDYSTRFTPTHVGNCELTEIQLPLEDDVEAELTQIIRDCPDSNMRQYLSYSTANGLEYSGSGIYSFQMNGVTYYTNEKDLFSSMETPRDYNKPIDAQQKLAYYNASYVKTRVEETNKALLETDGNGRFKSIKFDDDSIVYTLNTETVTDDAAYQDAMNEYNYKVQQYEKTIADINAKTSIIQEEDRTLELRLKQLDTEQNALATEMEAVKKVIKDNVEKTFKTFSD